MLVAARHGDGSAFERLYDAFSQRVAAFARSRGVRDPEGLVNDVFLGVFNGLTTFEGSAAGFEAWVFRIARNKIADEFRRRSREPSVADGEPSETVWTGDVEADALASIGDAWVQRRLTALSADQRDVLLLRIVADLTIEQAAAVLGKRPGAIKALQRRALRRLANEIRAEGVTL